MKKYGNRTFVLMGICFLVSTVFSLKDAYGLATSTEQLVSTSTISLSLTMPTSTDLSLESTNSMQDIATTTQDTATSTIDAGSNISTTTLEIATSSPVIDTVPQRLASSTIDALIQSVADEQSAFMGKKGRYLQVLDGGRLPDYETDDLQTDFGTSSLSHISVNVYEGPSGKGYQIIYKDKYVVKAVGYGPEAASLTYAADLMPVSTDLATSTATTTPLVVSSDSTSTPATSDDGSIVGATTTPDFSLPTDISTSSTDLSPIMPTSTDQTVITSTSSGSGDQ